MGDEKEKAPERLAGVREKIAVLVGLDGDSAANDEAVVNAFEEFCGSYESRVELKAAELADSPERLEALRKDVEAAVDAKHAADEILANAEGYRAARRESAEQDPQRKGTENLEEASRAKDAIIARVKGAQSGAMSGVMALALGHEDTMATVLRRPVAVDDPVRLLQRAHDEMVTVKNALMIGAADNDKYPSLHSLECYKQWSPLFADVSKAFSISDAGAWTPTYYSADMIENIYQTTQVAGLFARQPWPGPGGTLTVPVEGDDLSLYGAAEATTDDDDVKYVASDPSVGTSLTVTAKTFAVRTVWSYELEEDSIIPILPHIQTKFTRAFAFGLDEAFLDGDADGTHQDTGLTLATNGDHRELFNGLRKKALADTMTSAVTYFNAEQLMTPLLGMGAYGQPATSVELPSNGTVGLCSHATLLKLAFLRDTQNARVAGNDSAIIGPPRSLLGYPLYGSQEVRSDMNASGIYDGSTTTQTYLLWVHVPAWRVYEKAETTMQVIDRPELGQKVMVARGRLAFRHMHPDAATSTRMVYYFVDTAFA